MRSRTRANMSAPVIVLQPFSRAMAMSGVITGAVITQPTNIAGVSRAVSMGSGSETRMPAGVAFSTMS